MKLSQIHEFQDMSDVTPLYPNAGLFLKPMSRINITIHFPTLKQSIPTGGTNVSSWGIMEKLKALAAPDTFISIKTVKNTLEFIRFEGDLENRTILKGIVGRLDGKKMKVTGIKEPLKILAAETKLPFPTKYDWDSFFRDARHMNEMKPGERPDTIHFQNLPIEWFSSHDSEKDTEQDFRKTKGKKTTEAAPLSFPSQRIFRRVWEAFGEIRTLDIPMLDPYRSRIKSSLAGIKTFTFNLDRVFEGYVQYKEYLGFVRAMEALRGSFLARKDGDKLFVASIKVDFDKSKHLSEEFITKRAKEIQILKSQEVSDNKSGKKPSAKGTKKGEVSETESEARTEKDPAEIDRKIAMEERKYLVARRKLEAIRLIDFLFERLKAKKILEEEKFKRRRKKKLRLKRAAKAESAAATQAASCSSPKKTKADEMRERIIAARLKRAEGLRRKELVAKSVKRAIHSTRTRAANQGRPNFIYASPHIFQFSFRQQRNYEEVEREQEFPITNPGTIYGSEMADRAYEKYFQSISRRPMPQP